MAGTSEVSFLSLARFSAPGNNRSYARSVSQPLNFSRAGELMPVWFGKTNPPNLRPSLNPYRSKVDALPGPDNRLDDQQPWTATLRFDQRLAGLPLTVGGCLTPSPAYGNQLTLAQTLRRTRTHTVDLYGLWVFRPGLQMRLAVAQGAQPFGPPNGANTTVLASGDYTRVERRMGRR